MVGQVLNETDSRIRYAIEELKRNGIPMTLANIRKVANVTDGSLRIFLDYEKENSWSNYKEIISALADVRKTSKIYHDWIMFKKQERAVVYKAFLEFQKKHQANKSAVPEPGHKK